MPAKRSLTLALALLLAIALPVRGATPPVLQQIDLRPLTESSQPGELVPFAGKIFFSANDGTYGQELWRTDGAPDGTHVGTELACDLAGGAGVGSSPYLLTVVGDTLYFGANGEAGSQLYSTNGAIDGCQQITVNNTGDAIVDELRALGDQLWFSANDGVHGREPWVTDGTTTSMVANINGFNIAGPNAGGSGPREFTKLGSDVYFSADDGIYGNELWRSGAGGTNKVTDINQAEGYPYLTAGSYPQNLTVVGDQLFFAVTTTSGERELASVGASGPVHIYDINAGPGSSYPSQLTNFNGQLYFNAFTDASGYELWHMNGANPELVMNISSGDQSSDPSSLTPVGDWLYFNARDNLHGNELWRTDGTAAHTTMIKDIFPGFNSNYPNGFIAHGGAIFFAGSNGTYNTIFQTGGTEASTIESITVTGTSPNVGCECRAPIVFLGDRIFTYLSTTEGGNEVAFVDPLLPSTNRDGSGWSTALVLLAAVTAAAGLTVRMREAKRR